MDIKELQQKSKAELAVILREAQEDLRQARFSAAGGELKTVRQIRVLRQRVAQVLTLLRIKK